MAASARSSSASGDSSSPAAAAKATPTLQPDGRRNGAGEGERRFQGRDHAAGEARGGFAQRVLVLGPEARHDGELVAAQARAEVGAAEGAAQAPRHLLQQPVARQVAVHVVDGLEPVEVDEQRGHRPALLPRLRQGVGEVLAQAACGWRGR